MKSFSQGWRFSVLASVSASLLAAVLPVASAGISPHDEKIGVTDTEVLFGSCTPLSGTLSERGHSLQSGSTAYFSSVNEKGINGRKIKVVFNDDKYDPEQAISCFNTCLKDKVFAGAFFVGSAPIAKYVRMGESSHMPMVGFCTGTPVAYEFHPTEFIVRAGYQDEVEKQIDELYAKQGIKRIAVIYQNDAFGAAIRENVIKSLKKHNAIPIAEASYSRKTTEVEDAVKRINDAKPEAVIIGATSKALVAIVQKRDEQHWKSLCLAFSVNADYLDEMGKAAEGMVMTQVIPLTDSKLPTADLYNKLRKRYTPGAQPNMTAFEAFINSMVIAEAVRRAGKDLTRTGFVHALESMHDYDLGLGPNFKLDFGPNNHNGLTSKSVYFTVVRDGKIKPVTSKELTALVKAAKS